jgi:hypothetical protein
MADRPMGALFIVVPASPETAQRHPLFGALKGLTQIAPGTDLTKPADQDWGRRK